MKPLSVHVRGLPVPQGSMRAFVNPNTGRAIVTAGRDAKVREWRVAVTAALGDANFGQDVHLGAVRLAVQFNLPRPASHYLPANRSRAQRVLRSDAPVNVATTPDLDKLIRAIGDAATAAGVWRDDAQVVRIVAEKRYSSEGDGPGAFILIEPWPREEVPA